MFYNMNHFMFFPFYQTDYFDGKSPEKLGQSKESLRKSRAALSRSKDSLSKSKESLSKSKEAISRSRDSLAKSKDALDGALVDFKNLFVSVHPPLAGPHIFPDEALPYIALIFCILRALSGCMHWLPMHPTRDWLLKHLQLSLTQVLLFIVV